MSVTLESAVFMEENYLVTCHSITNTRDLTLKQMFDTSTRLVSEQDEMSGVETIGWENHSWKYLSLIGDENVIYLQHTKVYVFSESVWCLGKIHENHILTVHGNTDWDGSKVHQKTVIFDRIHGEPMELEWNVSQDSIRSSSVKKSNIYC